MLEHSIKAVGDAIGMKQDDNFRTFRGRVRSYIGQHQNGSDRESPTMKMVKSLTYILGQISPKEAEDLKDQPWEKALARIKLETKTSQQSNAYEAQGQGPFSEDFKKTLRESQLKAAREGLEDKLKVYIDQLARDKTNFAEREKNDLKQRKGAILTELNGYNKGIERLQKMAVDLFERSTEVNAIREKEKTQISDLETLSKDGETFVKEYAPRIAQSTHALDENPVVSRILRDSNLFNIGSMIHRNNGDDHKIRESLQDLKTKIGSKIVTGIRSIFHLGDNRRAREGQKAIDELIRGLDAYQTATGKSVFDLEFRFKKNVCDCGIQNPIWDACFGRIKPDDIEENIQKPIERAIDAVKYINKKSEKEQLDGIALLKRHAFENNYADLPGFTLEQKAVFKDLDLIAGETDPFTFRATLSCECILKPENIVPALNETALNSAQQYRESFEQSAQERVDAMRTRPCPYTAFETANRTFADSITQHLRAAVEQKTDAAVDAYEAKAKELKKAIDDKLKELSTVEKADPVPRTQQTPRKPRSYAT